MDLREHGWIFLLTLVITRYVSLGSILAGVLFPFLIWIFVKEPAAVFLATLFAAFIVIRHKENIRTGSNDGVDELDTVLSHLAFWIFFLRFFNPALDLTVILRSRLHKMEIHLRALGIDVGIAGVMLIFSFMVTSLWA